jgi:hypothetical protein
MLGKRLGRKGLAAVATIASPETILRWYRELVARKYDGSQQRGQGRLEESIWSSSRTIPKYSVVAPSPRFNQSSAWRCSSRNSRETQMTVLASRPAAYVTIIQAAQGERDRI